MYKYLQFFPEEKTLHVRFLARLSSLCLLDLNKERVTFKLQVVQYAKEQGNSA